MFIFGQVSDFGRTVSLVHSSTMRTHTLVHQLAATTAATVAGRMKRMLQPSDENPDKSRQKNIAHVDVRSQNKEEIKKEEVWNNNTYTAIPYYGKFLHSFKYMGEAALVLQLPFASISLYANGYSYPAKNFNFGLNIGYLIFNPKMLD